MGLASVYVLWRGPNDYRSLKAWRARGLASKALKKAALGSAKDATRLIDKALTLAPRDAFVLRTLADLGEPTEDQKALQALRRLIPLGLAETRDLERLCRLAFDWGHPEMAPAETLQQWAEQPAEKLGAIELEAAARWLASRGLEAAAEDRLRRAVALAPFEASDQPRFNLALGELLVSRSVGSPSAFRLQEAKARWMETARHVFGRPRHQAQALGNVVALLGNTDGGLFQPAPDPAMRQILRDRIASTTGEERMSFRLIAADFDLLLNPERKGVALELLEAAASDGSGHLALGQWLVKHRYFSEALFLCDRDRRATTDREWFIVKLNAYFAQRSWNELTEILEEPAQPISDLLRALFRFRTDLAAGRDSTELQRRRNALIEAAAKAEANDVLFSAGNLEMAGQTELAIPLYHRIRHHQQIGLSAFLGLVRCLNRHPDRAAELKEALEGVLKIVPHSQEARADLIYLGLLDGTPTPDDIAEAKHIVSKAPQLLGFRIIAALAELQTGQAAEALGIINGASLPWDDVRPGWRAVYAAVLAANAQQEQARALTQTIKREQLRPGERKLLENHGLTDLQ